MTEVKRNTVRALIADAIPKIGRFEAFILLAHILDKPKEYLIAHDDDELTDTTVMTFDMFVSMRLDGMPVPYLTGHQEFFGRYFAVDPNVLIPRPDTEVLIEQALMVTPERPIILDMGTGSGCIAITMAKECPGSRVTATDFSEGALNIAKTNAQTLEADIDFRLGSWWTPIKENEKFDLILSNPPYIRPNDEHLPALHHEPQTALTDGVDGLSCLHEIAATPLNTSTWVVGYWLNMVGIKQKRLQNYSVPMVSPPCVASKIMAATIVSQWDVVPNHDLFGLGSIFFTLIIQFF